MRMVSKPFRYDQTMGKILLSKMPKEGQFGEASIGRNRSNKRLRLLRQPVSQHPRMAPLLFRHLSVNALERYASGESEVISISEPREECTGEFNDQEAGRDPRCPSSSIRGLAKRTLVSRLREGFRSLFSSSRKWHRFCCEVCSKKAWIKKSS